jgi:hypothetical protein
VFDARYFLRRQLRTPFRASAIQDLPPALCCHARSKAMCACPLDSAGLERAFHFPQSWTCRNLKRAAQKEGRQGYAGEKFVSIEYGPGIPKRQLNRILRVSGEARIDVIDCRVFTDFCV